MAASSENLAAIDPFLLRRQSFSDMCWLNPADNEKALYGNHHDYFSLLLQQPDHHQSFSASSHDLQQTPSTLDPKRRIAAVNKSRITKRKSRATKKNQTTFITADPANFRQMVQQVTGIKLDTSSPLSHQLLKPETTRRPIGRLLLYNACQLPTLDTSSFLLEHNHQQQQSQSTVMASSGALVDGETGSDGFGIASFPTLESWKVM